MLLQPFIPPTLTVLVRVTKKKALVLRNTKRGVKMNLNAPLEELKSQHECIIATMKHKSNQVE